MNHLDHLDALAKLSVGEHLLEEVLELAGLKEAKQPETTRCINCGHSDVEVTDGKFLCPECGITGGELDRMAEEAMKDEGGKVVEYGA